MVDNRYNYDYGARISEGAYNCMKLLVSFRSVYIRLLVKYYYTDVNIFRKLIITVSLSFMDLFEREWERVCDHYCTTLNLKYITTRFL